MAEYIEREELINQIRLMVNRSSVGETSLNDISAKTICGLILEAPTANVVEVVRCKDCKKWDETRRFGISCACSHWSPSIKDCRFTLPDGFCSEGIRKEGAEE